MGFYIGKQRITPVINKGRKFGVTIDGLIGTIDESGTLQLPTEEFVLNGQGIKSLVFPGLKSKFESCPITAVYLPNLTSVADQCLDLMCAGCSKLKVLDLSNLETATGNYVCENIAYSCPELEELHLEKLRTIDGQYAFVAAFAGCKKLQKADLKSLQTISNSSSVAQMFYGCTGLKEVDLSSLQTITGSGCCQSMFKNCTGLTKVSFPALTTISTTNAFGSGTALIFYGCSGITELHFRADTQATIEAMTGYSTKFGATSSTIYFDL